MNSSRSDRYHGAIARSYEEKRRNDGMWEREDEALEAVMAGMPPRCRVIDIPVGTGRFFPIYEASNASVVGVDISRDMIALAVAKAADMALDPEVVEGSIFDIPYGAASFDLAVCIRLMNWLDIDDVNKALGELARVSGDRLVVSIAHAIPVSVSTVAPRALAEGGRLVRRVLGRKPIVLHSRTEVQAAIEGSGLVVVDTFALHSRRGAWEYVLWSLQKAR